MPVHLQPQRTTRFIEPGLYLSLGVTGLMFLALIVAGFSGRTLLSQRLQVAPESSVQLPPVQVKPSPIGALRIDAQASLSNNRWLTYEIQLLDSQGKVLASAIKEAWKESGTWYEDGESGRWQEDDLRGGLDVRPSKKEAEALTLAIAVLEYTTSSGQDINEPVWFDVKVKNGIADSRYLWMGLVGTLCLTAICWKAVDLAGTRVVNKRIGDSDVGDRRIVGGDNNLIKVEIDVVADETSPRQLYAHLWVRDGNGEDLYHGAILINLHFKRNNSGSIERATGRAVAYFYFEKRGSYGFYVEVKPDNPVDSTTLKVYDKVRTKSYVDLVTISSR